MEIAQTIDDALTEYYSEKGVEVPNWKRDKDPQWWKDYLISLGVDPSRWSKRRRSRSVCWLLWNTCHAWYQRLGCRQKTSLIAFILASRRVASRRP